MKTGHTWQTIALTYKEICDDGNPWIPLGKFMHDFFGNHADQREKLVREAIQEPEHPTPEQHQWAVFCAASVEYLCQKYHLPCPEWVFASTYQTLPEPWFKGLGAHKPRVQERLRRETPEPFARRNIYCGDRIFANKYEITDDLQHRRSA